MSYSVPADQACAEIEVKKSRFIAYAKGIESREQGMQWLQALRQQYPDARHHCWAYQLGHPDCATNAGMGDDGEPSGTAGKPILNVLQHKGVGDIMIVVVRYFGGIKLGAGGLTRAYGQAAQAVMEALPTKQQVAMAQVDVTCDFALEQTVRHWVGELNGEITQVDYQQQVAMQLQVPCANVLTLTEKLAAHPCSFKTR